MTDAARVWGIVGSFQSVTAAVRQIIHIEDKQISGIHLEMYVDATVEDNDDEATGYFEYTGKKALYAIKRHRL
ncbi:MAG: hypothetical protein P4M05_33500 [Bradyrhizobium sp.]|nr:hypothetical protein [Bradyrhizobium sp.]